jgi:AcrR family transcriptional regulator
MAGEERRSQILAVAVSLFSNKGFSGTTTKEIAHAAGVSEAMVFRHFATKEELYAAIIDHKTCAHDPIDPMDLAADAIKRKDDRAVFETLALAALDHHEKNPEFQRLLLHSALEKHQLAQMFFNEFVRRCLIGMVMHHSLNNNLWDPDRRLLDISNEAAAKHFTEILLHGITARKS